MTGPPKMEETITSSLERSLRNCSLNSDSPEETHSSSGAGAGLDLNSQISLPYHWEQCLDLKTGEVYYINWRTGMKAKEDPRTTSHFYSEDEEEEDDDDDDSSYEDSEESSSESSPSSYSRVHHIYDHDDDRHNSSNVNDNSKRSVDKRDSVLVVAGCKSCLMYFMVPKQDSICPKCFGQLLHFDQH